MVAAELSTAAGLRYGALGLPLAFVALPLYVNLPAFYAQQYGVPLATLGLLLLVSRALDALADPFIGWASDRWLQAGKGRTLGLMSLAAGVLALAFGALFMPPTLSRAALLAWCALMLMLAYLAYSVLSVMHQAWGARLGGSALQQTRLNAWREGLALAGVVGASVLPSLAGWPATSSVLALALAAALALLARAPHAPDTQAVAAPRVDPWLPWQLPGFRRLLPVFLLNGVAAAVPATLLLFFVRDRLQTPQAEPLYLGLYFLSAACSMPLWLRAVARWGQARSWALGMLLALACFAWAAVLGTGAQLGFAAICIGSGAALGADLSIPGAMLTRVLQNADLSGRAEGAFFGWWQLCSKLNLALAAGLALPLLGLLGYAPGQRDPQALQALALAYCVLPCVLKAAALALLYLLWIRQAPTALALKEQTS
ncbi:MFS transporter [Paucibacter soli]|uniref:MFS transporter n=1 Tax=Paucibacter soli TaxID=3133433 RepID=UPI003099D326